MEYDSLSRCLGGEMVDTRDRDADIPHAAVPSGPFPGCCDSVLFETTKAQVKLLECLSFSSNRQEPSIDPERPQAH
ncbi:unnamed protein product [Lupinus luteus]|uniref:Uncharacterized protein n=1 Tax=Lupinus luteus TaxID=3873 RepID=A0AAV1Y712_LUPLU